MELLLRVRSTSIINMNKKRLNLFALSSRFLAFITHSILIYYSLNLFALKQF